MKEICPICQNNNDCGMKKQGDCWCTQISFPPVDIEKLALPNVCICAACAKKLGAKYK